MGSDRDLLGRGAGLERVGDKDDLDVQLVELLAKDAHGTHDIKQIEAVKDEGAQLEGGDACGDLGKRAMDCVGTFGGRHFFPWLLEGGWDLKWFGLIGVWKVWKKEKKEKDGAAESSPFIAHSFAPIPASRVEWAQILNDEKVHRKMGGLGLTV